jgi:hypothetical protein
MPDTPIGDEKSGHGAGRLDLTGIVLDKAVLDAGRQGDAIALSK